VSPACPAAARESARARARERECACTEGAPGSAAVCVCVRERGAGGGGETFITKLSEGQKKIANKVEKIREAKATTLRRVTRALMHHGRELREGHWEEVKGVDSRAGSVGGRTIATICSQFHKLR